ncbi:MAG: hypothetical protein ABSA57_13870 [Candidatus Acidiferrales bacterium]|jgi:hypothetical protein
MSRLVFDFDWCQGRGGVIATEHPGKFWMIAGSISRNRTDGLWFT